MGNCCACLDDNQFVIANFPVGRTVKQGPGCFSFCCASLRRGDKITMTDTQYITIKHLDLGDEDENGNSRDLMEVIEGPGMYEQDDPYAEVRGPFEKPKLTKTQFLVVTDEKTGDKRVVNGPCMFTPGPYDKFGSVQNIIVLTDTEYLKVTHTDLGTVEIVKGPCKFSPGAHDTWEAKRRKIVLEHDEWIKVVDNNTGVIRVITGPATVTLQPFEVTIKYNSKEVQKGVEINEHSAAYIKDTKTGNYELVTMRTPPDDEPVPAKDEDEESKLGDGPADPSTTYGPFMFFPSPTQEIVEHREKIRLENTQVVVIIDKDGKYNVIKATDKKRSFFVPPYCKLLTQRWSTDLAKSKTQVTNVTRFDTRPQFMDFEFLIRTRDNVEIFLDLNFFWQIVDVAKMVDKTDDPPEDICRHAQSQILSDISRVDMKEFMESFNDIIQTSISKDDTFYVERGVKLLRVEITGRRCKDDETEKNFQAIITEKTKRIKNLEEREGKNEVRVAELEGEIKAEELQGKVVAVRKGYLREEARTDGESDADKITNFFENLPKDLTTEQKLKIYWDYKNTERVQYVTDSMAKTGTPMYVKPDDVDAKIINVHGTTTDGKVDVSVPVSSD